MKGKIMCILVCMLMLSSVVGALPSAITSTTSKDAESVNKGYSHNILGEYFTLTTCVPCKYAHAALKELYARGYHPFYYITYVCDVNNNSNDRKNELGVVGTPNVAWDGDYRRDGGGSDNETDMARYNTSIIKCGNRDVKDIDLSLNVEWLGAVNPDPEDGETGVPVEQVMSWTDTEMKIDVEVTSNEADQYNGHLHVQVTEVNSSFYNDKWGNPYTFEFKDYAYNDDVTISGVGTWSDSINWDGCDYNDSDDPPHYFDYITQDNIMVIAAVFDEDNDDYVDETAGFRAGDGTDPKTFDVYFGDTTPPPKRVSNTSRMFYSYSDLLNFSTVYYWKIDVWDNQGNLIFGDIWNFTTRGNDPPIAPFPMYPVNNSHDVPIDTDLRWICVDPDGDDVTFDVYFGEGFYNPPQVAHNISDTTWKIPGELKFLTPYVWKIVAWDEYGLNTTGGPFFFTTEPNYPPDPAYNPVPPDGANNIPGDAIIYWNGSDPNSGDKLRYDVYFSINYPPGLESENQTDNFFDPYGPANMPLHKEFYWKIVTRDKEGEETPGPNWSFSTGINPPPTDPEIDGPSKGRPNVEYNFTFVSTDPDNQNISYYVDWGDNTNTGWTSFHYSGEVVTLNHTWEDEEPKTYTITAIAKDIYGEKSGVSEHEFTTPRNKAINFNLNLLCWLFERFPRVFQFLRYLLGL